MADWPELDELAQVVNVDNVEDWTVTLTRVLAAAIDRVKYDVGNWATEDEPDERLAQAALRMGELMSERPDGDPSALSRDPAYQALLRGHRRVFGVS